MRAVSIFATFGLATAGQARHPVQQDVVDRVNGKGLTWTAEQPARNRFSAYTLQEIKGLMGVQSYPPVAAQATSRLGSGDIPDAFDAREKWPSCKKQVRDQAHCGSCWAFGAAETLTDNLCVLGSTKEALSAQDLVSCDNTDYGCHGGTLPTAWKFIQSRGLVSEACMPYTSGDGKSNGTCTLPGCAADGVDSTVYKCPVAPSFLDSDAAIQAAVMTVGAVEVAMTVMEDFINYQGGIYNYSEGAILGGHAVKIVGWGQQGAAFYWIVQNSWGPSWGEDGYFRIVNWHNDKMSAIAIGGGQACVQGNMPAPPTPSPKPAACEDIVSYCNDKEFGRAMCATKPYIVPVCQKTCGCCGDDLKPAYCGKGGDLVV